MHIIHSGQQRERQNGGSSGQCGGRKYNLLVDFHNSSLYVRMA